MKKINTKDLNLLVANVEFKGLNTEYIEECVKFLISLRVNHCRTQLEEAIKKDEAFYANHLDSEIIFFYGKSGKEYGHFSGPVYNIMMDFLNGDEQFDSPMIVQQALRQMFYLKENSDLKQILQKYNKTEEDLYMALTEMLLCQLR